MSEMRQHPWTTFTSLVALVGVAIMFPSYLTAQSIAQRVASIESIQQQQIRETLTNRLGGLRSAQFDIKARIDEMRARGEAPDRIFYDELKRLTNEIDEVERQIARLPPA